MRQFVKYLSLFLAIVIITAIPANAVETGAERSSSFFARSSVYLYETTSTTFQAWFEVTGMRTMDKIGAKEIKIQRSSDNENWTTVKTYSMDDYYSTLICENTAGHAACVTYTGTRGYYYRAYIKLYAEDETGTAVWNRYTSSIYID